MDKADFVKENPELFHYTTLGGVMGIIEKNQIFATHYNFLNDTTELKISSDFLFETIYPVTEEALLKLSESTQKHKEKFIQLGGVKFAAKEEARAMIETMFHAAEQCGGIYLSSFCGNPKNEYVRKNGLLSQWRGYGATGGYCIVFDTEKLIELLDEETKKVYIDVGINKIFYSDEKQKYLEINKKNINYIKEDSKAILAHVINKSHYPINSNILNAFLNLVTFYKHCGFSEEREIRIGAFPQAFNDDFIQMYKDNGKEPERPKCDIHYRDRNGLAVPYIKLFEKLKIKLPIAEIIVGPQTDQSRKKDGIEHMVKNLDIKVTLSELPFAG